MPTALQVDKDSRENEFDELKPGMCEVDEELSRKQDTVQEYLKFWYLHTLVGRDQLTKGDGVIWIRYFWLQN